MFSLDLDSFFLEMYNNSTGTLCIARAHMNCRKCIITQQSHSSATRSRVYYCSQNFKSPNEKLNKRHVGDDLSDEAFPYIRFSNLLGGQVDNTELKVRLKLYILTFRKFQYLGPVHSKSNVLIYIVRIQVNTLEIFFCWMHFAKKKLEKPLWMKNGDWLKFMCSNIFSAWIRL